MASKSLKCVNVNAVQWVYCSEMWGHSFVSSHDETVSNKCLNSRCFYTTFLL